MNIIWGPALKATILQVVSLLQQHFHMLNFWKLQGDGSSDRISPDATVFQMLQLTFLMSSTPELPLLWANCFALCCALWIPPTPPQEILINLVIKEQTRTHYAGLFKATEEPLPMSKEFPSHLNAWIRNNNVQPSKTSPILLLADGPVGCRFICAITSPYVVTYRWAHDVFLMIIMTSTY